MKLFMTFVDSAAQRTSVLTALRSIVLHVLFPYESAGVADTCGVFQFENEGSTTMNLRGIAVAALLTVTLAACGGAGSSGAQTPGERLIAAMELIRDGKPTELEAFVVSDDRPGVAMFSGVYSSGWAREGGLSRVEIVSEEINGDTATVAARFHFANGSTEDVTYRLEYEGSAWKMILP